MKLIPEQLEGIEARIRELKKNISSYGDYLAEANNDIKHAFSGQNGKDDFTEMQLEKAHRNLAELERIVRDAEIVDAIDETCVTVGTTFEVVFANGSKKELTLVERLIGLEDHKKYFSIESPFGQSVIGKEEGATFSYKVKTSPYESRTISGTILTIGKDKALKVKEK